MVDGIIIGGEGEGERARRSCMDGIGRANSQRVSRVLQAYLGRPSTAIIIIIIILLYFTTTT